MITPRLQRPIRRLRNARLAVVLVLAVSGCVGWAEETNTVSVPEAPGQAEAKDSYLRLQEQLHSAQLALEKSRQESEALAARNAEAVASRLERIELNLAAAQRAREVESTQRTSYVPLAVASAFAGVGFVALLLSAYLQWRTVNRLAGFAAVLAGVTRVALPGAVGLPVGDASSTRLIGALNRLEQRILELEHPNQLARAGESASSSFLANTAAPAETPAPREAPSRAAILLAKGQSLLSLGQADAALQCFDEILAQCPDHPEAWVKKGLALEQQNKTTDALRCYDRAIDADADLTQAYLQKAALCSRLEQFDQAARCYEEVLRVQEQRQRA
jgi:tetratricopeptide (TPR) repeat protein